VAGRHDQASRDSDLAAPKLKGHRDLLGTELDVAKLQQWLRSNQSGA